jgi:DNA-binding CsgD family transcriptional regulator
MDLWKWLRNRLEQQESDAPAFCLEKDLLTTLEEVANQEQRSTEEVAVRLLSQAIQERQENDAFMKRWKMLSLREQEITALTCLGYTNRQAATYLSISSETVKTHVRNIFYKFNVNSKHELRTILARWDFSGWSPRSHR